MYFNKIILLHIVGLLLAEALPTANVLEHEIADPANIRSRTINQASIDLAATTERSIQGQLADPAHVDNRGLTST